MHSAHASPAHFGLNPAKSITQIYSGLPTLYLHVATERTMSEVRAAVRARGGGRGDDEKSVDDASILARDARLRDARVVWSNAKAVCLPRSRGAFGALSHGSDDPQESSC